MHGENWGDAVTKRDQAKNDVASGNVGKGSKNEMPGSVVQRMKSISW